MIFNDRINRLKLKTIKAADQMAGISIMTSGTAVVSVSATGVMSGDIISVTPYMFANALTDVASGNKVFVGNLAVSSVRADAFTIFAVGSRAPAVDCPISWVVIRK